MSSTKESYQIRAPDCVLARARELQIGILTFYCVQIKSDSMRQAVRSRKHSTSLHLLSWLKFSIRLWSLIHTLKTSSITGIRGDLSLHNSALCYQMSNQQPCPVPLPGLSITPCTKKVQSNLRHHWACRWEAAKSTMWGPSSLSVLWLQHHFLLLEVLWSLLLLISTYSPLSMYKLYQVFGKFMPSWTGPSR